MNETAQELFGKLEARTARIGIIGMGYVGLPLAVEFVHAGFPVTGFDLDPKKTEALNAGRSYIRHIPDEAVASFADKADCAATTDFDELADCDCIVICVPTPLTKNREPDVSYIESTARTIAPRLRKGQLITLESTTYPGTSREVLQPLLEEDTGLVAGEDYFLAYSPEREDPGNAEFGTKKIPKVVGGLGDDALKLACAMYDTVVVGTVPVSTPDAAEATKLLENIFRSVNIALVNELKVVFDRMGIDVWEVIEAAKTKPFGYMPFYPGPGLGGHCIPIDPFYLTWKAREFGVATRFIELAGEVNTSMPDYVVSKCVEALNEVGKPVKGSRVLVLGLAYKPNVDDDRESPSYTLIEKLEERGAVVEYHDPFVPVVPMTREHAEYAGRESREPSEEHDLFLLSTHHDAYSGLDLAKFGKPIVDTRNCLPKDTAGLTRA